MKVAFDVDETLIRKNDFSMDIPRFEVIQLFRLMQGFGCQMYIWSGSGVDYAAHWRDKLGLDAIVVAKGSFKPNLAVDDMEVTLGLTSMKV
jgi:predicted HAD superfamily phosphohydrolase YqeG